MGREEAGNPELELLSQGPYRVGLPQGTPVPKALGLASPPFTLERSPIGEHWVLCHSPGCWLPCPSWMRERDREKRSWSGQWGRDQIASSCPRHSPPLGPKSWLCLSVLPAFPWHAPLIVGWEALGPTESEGTDLFPKVPSRSVPASCLGLS